MGNGLPAVGGGAGEATRGGADVAAGYGRGGGAGLAAAG